MESFSVNSAKSYVGRNVNLHLKDGAVIVNVHLTGILKTSSKNSLVEYTSQGKPARVRRVPLRNIAWAELLNLILLQKAS